MNPTTNSDALKTCLVCGTMSDGPYCARCESALATVFDEHWVHERKQAVGALLLSLLMAPGFLYGSTSEHNDAQSHFRSNDQVGAQFHGLMSIASFCFFLLAVGAAVYAAYAIFSATRHRRQYFGPGRIPTKLLEILTEKTKSRILIVAAKGGNATEVSRLVEGGLSAGAGLVSACMSRDIDAIQALVAAGADINAKTAEGESALHVSARLGLPAKVIDALIASGADLNLRNSKGRTAIDVARENSHPDLSGRLLKAGARDFSGELMRAVQAGSADQVKALLNEGADPNAKDTNGWSVVMLAVKSGMPHLLGILVNSGADINSKTSEGLTPLMAAAASGDTNCVIALISLGADVNAKTNKGFTALINAAAKTDLRCINALIAAGAEVNARTSEGVTALRNAIATKKKDIAQALIAAGAK